MLAYIFTFSRYISEYGLYTGLYITGYAFFIISLSLHFCEDAIGLQKKSGFDVRFKMQKQGSLTPLIAWLIPARLVNDLDCGNGVFEDQ